MQQAPWTQWLSPSLPSKREKISRKASQSDQSNPGGKRVLTFGFQSHCSTAVAVKIQAYLGY
jgi:hypothetical protein